MSGTSPTYEAAAQLSGNLLSFAGKAATEVLDAAAASANIPKVGSPTVIVVSTDGSYGPTLQLILKELTKMSAEVDALKQADANLATAVTNAANEISTLAAQIAANAGDPAAVAAVAADIQQRADALNQAVASAQPTPPGPVPTPTPTPEPTPAPTPDPNPTPAPTPDPNQPTS